MFMPQYSCAREIAALRGTDAPAPAEEPREKSLADRHFEFAFGVEAPPITDPCNCGSLEGEHERDAYCKPERHAAKREER